MYLDQISDHRFQTKNLTQTSSLTNFKINLLKSQYKNLLKDLYKSFLNHYKRPASQLTNLIISDNLTKILRTKCKDLSGNQRNSSPHQILKNSQKCRLNLHLLFLFQSTLRFNLHSNNLNENNQSKHPQQNFLSNKSTIILQLSLMRQLLKLLLHLIKLQVRLVITKRNQMKRLNTNQLPLPLLLLQQLAGLHLLHRYHLGHS